ncbi:transposase family protein [Mycobacterium ulcerans str. Harvey]|uniref:Transposase family protein n=1 Tax=Mycobacterium ulcerans str. Harvey TaxID=1299332 RepID=A0ABP3ABE3_MYCUL|nr:transposase family protein [Mycobacterium ulcerans str. Harvey]
MVPIALDGKMLRGAYAPKRQPRISCRCSPPCPMVLGQLAVAEKSNEIPCVRALLTLLPITCGAGYCGAMHTQVVTRS